MNMQYAMLLVTASALVALTHAGRLHLTSREECKDDPAAGCTREIDSIKNGFPDRCVEGSHRNILDVCCKSCKARNEASKKRGELKRALVTKLKELLETR